MIKIFKKSHDGGADSGVTGYWLIEWKSLFSIVLLRFGVGSRDAYHSHAFNALTWWIKGSVEEHFYDETTGELTETKKWLPSWIPKLTPKKCFHKIVANEVSWAISFRGKWDKTWKEHKDGETYRLTHGRNKVNLYEKEIIVNFNFIGESKGLPYLDGTLMNGKFTPRLGHIKLSDDELMKKLRIIQDNIIDLLKDGNLLGTKSYIKFVIDDNEYFLEKGNFLSILKTIMICTKSFREHEILKDIRIEVVKKYDAIKLELYP